MNKLILSDEICSTKIKESLIEVNGKSELDLIDVDNDMNLEIEIMENATLYLNIFSVCKNLEINLNIRNKDNSKLILSNSFINRGTYTLNIDTKLVGNNILNDVNIRGINEKNGKLNIVMNGKDYENTKDNVMNEYAKIINKSDEKAVLIPNLLVDTMNVEANHGVSIGTIRNSEIFYLETKGIPKNEAIKILEDGYLLSIMNDNVKNKIKEILQGR